MPELYYIYKKRITQHGHNDGYEETNEPDILLTVTNNAEKAKEFRERFEFEYYKQLEQSVILSKQQMEDIGKLFGQPEDYTLSNVLDRLSYADFKKLADLIKIEFTLLRVCEPDPQKYYPLFNHHLLMKLDLESLNHMELDDLIDNLSGNDPDEAFEKGLFLLLLMNFLPLFIGDPETTKHDAEFREGHEESLVKMREFFKPPADLVSRHQCMKFWLVEKGYPRYGETFPGFMKNKEEILGDNLLHFNKLVAFFKSHNKKLIYIVNVC
jgi:hypothetical protein